MQVESLRRIATPQRAAELWKLLPEGVAGRPCPWCAGPLSEVQLTLDDRRLALDVCRTCQGAWFDAKELATFTPTPPAPLRGPRLSPSARLAVGLAKVEADALGRKAVTQAGTAVVILYAVLRVLRRLLR